MKPWKSFSPISKWMMRIGLAAFLLFKYLPLFLDFNYDTLAFIYATVFLLGSVLLIIGGLAKQTLTLAGGLILLIMSVIHMISEFNSINAPLASWVMIAGISLFFLSNGNK